MDGRRSVVASGKRVGLKGRPQPGRDPAFWGSSPNWASSFPPGPVANPLRDPWKPFLSQASIFSSVKSSGFNVVAMVVKTDSGSGSPRGTVKTLRLLGLPSEVRIWIWWVSGRA